MFVHGGLATAAATALVLNLHYPLFGRPFLEGPLTSRPVLTLGNLAFAKIIKSAMIKEGVPAPDRTEVYSHGGCRGRIDIYEPERSGEWEKGLRPAVLYFHAGAFIAGDRIMGMGQCGWLASHGIVCLSASYRLTNRGAGVEGSIADAWASYRWLKANAQRLGVDATRIVVAGDSAGGLLATALATGLGADTPTGMGGKVPAGRSELPAAVLANWPATTIGSTSYVPRRADDGSWEPTPRGKDFPVANTFVPEKYGDDLETTQQRLRDVLAGGLLCFGRRWGGLLPATRKYPRDDAASVSPQRRASRRSDLPPMLLLTASEDQVVPCTQTSRFSEAAREAGNDVSQLVFEGAIHGGGAVNSAAGRQAALRFLNHHGLLHESSPWLQARAQTQPDGEQAGAGSDDPRDAIGGAMRAFNLEPLDYRYAEETFDPAAHARATIRLRPIQGQT